ncbi:toprim domain-containing protein [Sphingobacterium daejeonense]|uniref:toprim domain-containing protein n=1 Tax=Sphingobacterium daejeonense TaxID=371142 RepID=UPI0010C2CFF7|nr:toprim domain-containing protein [Sphingobacterium daejeonense]VTP93919.1 DNA primase (bacterial type) [Sphingobacterium daejeonense]
MTCEELKRIPLISILEYLEIPCARMNSREAWFRNPFKSGNEKTASTKVDIQRNIWYSHSEGLGGNNIDFLLKFLETDNLSRVLDWAGERKNILSFHQQTVWDKAPAMRLDNEPAYTIISIKPLGNRALTDYLSDVRKIDLEIAEAYCQEIYYRTAKGQGFFAVCFRNDAGGYELRYSYDKRSLLTKGITTIDNDNKDVVLFESFMDLLSFMTLKKNAGKAYLDANYCVLNTTANLQKAFPFFQRHNGITSYLDNDASGKKSYQILLGQFEKNAHRKKWNQATTGTGQTDQGCQ